MYHVCSAILLLFFLFDAFGSNVTFWRMIAECAPMFWSCIFAIALPCPVSFYHVISVTLEYIVECIDRFCPHLCLHFVSFSVCVSCKCTAHEVTLRAVSATALHLYSNIESIGMNCFQYVSNCLTAKIELSFKSQIAILRCRMREI